MRTLLANVVAFAVALASMIAAGRLLKLAGVHSSFLAAGIGMGLFTFGKLWIPFRWRRRRERQATAPTGRRQG